MSNYSLIKLSPPSSCGFSHFELQEKIKQHTGGRTHVSCSHAGSLWRACKSPAAPPPLPRHTWRGVDEVQGGKRGTGGKNGGNGVKRGDKKRDQKRASELLQRTRIPSGSSCDRRNRFRKNSCCTLKRSEEMKRKRVRGERRGERVRVRDGKRGKQEQIFIKSVRKPSAEVSGGR